MPASRCQQHDADAQRQPDTGAAGTDQPRELGTLCTGQDQRRGNTHGHSPFGLTLPGCSPGVPINSLKNETLL
jgi:hypothetical protein